MQPMTQQLGENSGLSRAEREWADERVTQFRCPGVSVSEDLSWNTSITSVIGKAQRHIFYLRKLERAKIPELIPLCSQRYIGLWIIGVVSESDQG